MRISKGANDGSSGIEMFGQESPADLVTDCCSFRLREVEVAFKENA